MIYTVSVTFDIDANTEHQAYTRIQTALGQAIRQSTLTYLDSEVIAARNEEDEPDDELTY